MLKIEFNVATKRKKGNLKTLIVDTDFPKEYLGKYVIRELDALEALNLQNEFIAEHQDAQNNPDDKDLVSGFQNKLLEAATTLNDKPFIMPPLKTIPKRYHHLLIAAFERINGVSANEERFLLQPS